MEKQGERPHKVAIETEVERVWCSPRVARASKRYGRSAPSTRRTRGGEERAGFEEEGTAGEAEDIEGDIWRACHATGRAIAGGRERHRLGGPVRWLA